MDSDNVYLRNNASDEVYPEDSATALSPLMLTFIYLGTGGMLMGFVLASSKIPQRVQGLSGPMALKGYWVQYF